MAVADNLYIFFLKLRYFFIFTLMFWYIVVVEVLESNTALLSLLATSGMI